MHISKYRSANVALSNYIILVAILVVSLWVIGMLTYYYQSSMEEPITYASMTDINMASQTMLDYDICQYSSDEISLEYDAVLDQYTLECELKESDEEWNDFRIQEFDSFDFVDIDDDLAIYEIE